MILNLDSGVITLFETTSSRPQFMALSSQISFPISGTVNGGVDEANGRSHACYI